MTGFTRVRLAAVFCGLQALIPVLAADGVAGTAPTAKAPNFLVIVADDMGYSDLGSFGGEIDTPNLDKLATAGVRFNNFHATPTCSPTRSSLLTGVDHHEAGIGNMAELLTPEQRGKPGYEGYLNDRVVTVADRLRESGYHTMLSGKWHLGTAPGRWPADRGFERSFALLQGGDNHYGVPDGRQKRTYVEDHKPITQLPDKFYSTDYFSDRLLDLLNEAKDDPRPFFAYLAFTAPHWPLQAPDESIAKYRGRYAQGYEVLRSQRLAQQKKLGLLDKVEPHPLVGARLWKQLTPAERAKQSRIMEVYAAMIDRIDSNVGRIVQSLEESGRLANTYIIFISDNGAAGSAYDSVGTFDKDFGKWIADNFDNSVDNIGRANSLVWYGPGWGQAGTAPSLLFKLFTSEGGTRVPVFIAGPRAAPHSISSALTHVTDIVPTILDLAGVPEIYKLAGRTALPIAGHSLTPLLNGKATAVRAPDEPLAEELFGGRSVIKGDWKALYLNAMAANVDPHLVPGKWLLFNIKEDRGETHDLAASNQPKLNELIEDWNAYAARTGIILPADAGTPVTPIVQSKQNSAQ